MKVSEMNFSMPLEQVAGKYQGQNILVREKAAGSLSFADVLERQKAGQEAEGTEEAQAPRFSKHAGERLASRNIELSQEQLGRLADGTSKARAKGIRESLVMVDNLAFIVNVKNNTVVTAMGSGDDKVFTNIDGAVVS